MRCSNLTSLAAPRQPHREHRALARLARQRHVAAHHARELAGDGKAESGAAEASRPSCSRSSARLIGRPRSVVREGCDLRLPQPYRSKRHALAQQSPPRSLPSSTFLNLLESLAGEPRCLGAACHDFGQAHASADPLPNCFLVSCHAGRGYKHSNQPPSHRTQSQER
jgi:hypothetical protein